VTKYSSDPLVQGKIDALVGSARELARRQFHPRDYPNFDFDSNWWDLEDPKVECVVRPMYAHFYDTPEKRPASLRNAQNVPAIPPAFADVVKALLVHRDSSISNLVYLAGNIRVLWRALRHRSPDKTADFQWDSLTEDDMRKAASWTDARHPRSASSRQSSWSVLIGFLRDNEILPDGFEFTGKQRIDPSHPDERRRRQEKVPSREVLEALAEIYRYHASSQIDRLIICALGLLLVCGFRVSELLTLPEDCLVRQKVNGRDRYGIRYWNRKTKDGAYKHATRWLSPLGAEFAAKCLDEIKSLTVEARNQARVLESDPKRVRIPWFGTRQELTRKETAYALSLNIMSLAPLIRNGYLKLKPIVRGYRKWSFRRADVERELLRRRPALNSLHISGKQYQPLSKTLLITFFYESDPQATTSRLLVRPLLYTSIALFLGGLEPKSASAFTRFGLNRPGDDPLKLRPHMVRHWLNTVANKSGMSAFQITLWMGRSNVLQTKLYLHEGADIADLSRELLKSGRLVGKHAREFARTPNKGEYLQLIRRAHVTHTGLCAETLLRDCKGNKNCDLGCSSFLAIKGDATALPRLNLRRSNYREALNIYRSIQKTGCKIVPRLREAGNKGLEYTDRMLKIARMRSKKLAT
jgi:hypothetical protein